MTNIATTTHFATMQEFKELLGITRACQVVNNPNTGKLFVYVTDNIKFKCQQGIDFDSPMKFIWEGDDTDSACLANVKETSNNVVYTF